MDSAYFYDEKDQLQIASKYIRPDKKVILAVLITGNAGFLLQLAVVF